MPLPPRFIHADFEVLGSLLEFDVLPKFGRKLQQLHAFLNVDSVVSTVHRQRRAWKSRVAATRAFENHASQDHHWYTYNAGGRNEAQLNIGMFGGERGHVRVGLGFEMSEKKGGRPEFVQFVYSAFVKLLKQNGDLSRGFAALVQEMGLEAEFWGPSSSELDIIPTEDTVDFLTSPVRTAQWIFVGKLLRCTQHAEVLGQPASFARVIDEVLGGLLPIWREANVIGVRA